MARLYSSGNWYILVLFRSEFWEVGISGVLVDDSDHILDNILEELD